MAYDLTDDKNLDEQLKLIDLKSKTLRGFNTIADLDVLLTLEQFGGYRWTKKK